jgi:hypothetical protein
MVVVSTTSTPSAALADEAAAHTATRVRARTVKTIIVSLLAATPPKPSI